MTEPAAPGPQERPDQVPGAPPGPAPSGLLARLRAAARGATRVPRGWWAWSTDYVYVAWRQARGLVTPGPPDCLASGSRVPVLLLPGIYETWYLLEPLARVLHRAGHPVHTVPGLRYNTAGLDESARVVAGRLDELGLDRVVLVAHSKGGLIGKQLMSQRPEPAPSSVGADGAPPRSRPDVVGMVAVNTPFAGSVYATYFPSRSVRALSPRFPAMRALAHEVAAHSRIVSVFGLFDPHVPGGSALAGATNVQLPVMGHFRTVAHPAVQRAVLEQVERLERTQPQAPPPEGAPHDGDAAT